jgi:ADP-dependent phosphofructokinase/glucokinase
MTEALDWAERYRELAETVADAATRSGPYLLGFNACVDAVWQVEADVLALLAGLAGPGSAGRDADDDTGARLLARVLERIGAGHGGELHVDWPGGPEWLGSRLPAPDRLQVGGTGPQAAWTLAELGGRAVVPLAVRSPRQLSVLHPAIEIADGHGLTSAHAAAVDPDAPDRPMHHILEFTAGTSYRGGVLPRSTRIILRFAADGIERDEQLVAAQPALLPTLRGTVVSGMNGIADADPTSWEWLDRMVDAWVEAAVPHVHLELADYPDAPALHRTAARYARRAHTLGLSLSELRAMSSSPDPGMAARGLAVEHGYRAVVVHADTWSLAVHRGDPADYQRRLLTGNLLASARAAAGRPQSRVGLPEHAVLCDDIPSSGAIGGGWTVSCAPAPWLPTPRTTIGLGDSFVAGFQLGAGLQLDTAIRDPDRRTTSASPSDARIARSQLP